MCRRVSLGECQRPIGLPVDALSAGHYSRHVAIADESSVVRESGADAANVGWAISSSVATDPEVVTRSLNRLAVPWLVWVAGSKCVRSTSLPWILDQRGAVAAVLGQ